jgi:hypothetical protein
VQLTTSDCCFYFAAMDRSAQFDCYFETRTAAVWWRWTSDSAGDRAWRWRRN